jgi:superfamily I DNA/RNA helicase
VLASPGLLPPPRRPLAPRVARLVLNGTDPQRILLLTFTRRAAAEMTRRAARILGESRRACHSIGRGVPAYDIGWSGTFHAIASRLLRLHANDIRLDPSFTVLDRSDSADLMNLVRNDLWYQPHLERLYDHPTARVGDLEKLDQISAGYESPLLSADFLKLKLPSKTIIALDRF